MPPGADRALARRLHRDARAAARASLRAELVHARAAARREHRLRRARQRLPRQVVVAAGASVASFPLGAPWEWMTASVAFVFGLGAIRSIGVLGSPAPPPPARLPPLSPAPPPPPVGSLAFPAVRRLEAVRDDLCRLIPLVAPAGREAAEDAWRAAAEADTALRWQAARLAAVAPHRGTDAGLLQSLEDGVACQERLVVAVADLVAASADPLAAARLQDATDRLHGLAQGLREVG